jgi:hypothetical protein
MVMRMLPDASSPDQPKCSAVTLRAHESMAPRNTRAFQAWFSSSPPAFSMSMRRFSTPT